MKKLFFVFLLLSIFAVSFSEGGVGINLLGGGTTGTVITSEQLGGSTL
ncbi:MAG: hypothetical protein ACRCSK_08355 [Fusobacteriaceae bacterium]